jgi:hypothetical protein
MQEKMKWLLAAGGVGFLGYAVWQFVRESSRAARAAQRPRQPWEMM